MLEAMIAGVSDPKELAGKAVGTLQRKQAELERALVGLVGDHQRLMLATQLRHIDFLDEEIARLDTEIETRLRPFDAAIANLDTIPGVGRRAAEAIIAAIGTDMSRFPTHRHLASWAKLCPGTRESGGKQHSGRIGKGNAHLRT